jgi:hypothetical protein
MRYFGAKNVAGFFLLYFEQFFKLIRFFKEKVKLAQNQFEPISWFMAAIAAVKITYEEKNFCGFHQQTNSRHYEAFSLVTEAQEIKDGAYVTRKHI